MSDILKTWCPNCKRAVLNVRPYLADGDEFTCGLCNQRFVVHFERLLTPRAADDGDASVKKYVRGANDELLDVSVHG